MNTNDLERALLGRCQKWMRGKDTNTGLLGPVQASARVFLVNAIYAWRAAEAVGQSDRLAPDLHTWLERILAAEREHVARELTVEVEIPRDAKH